MYNKLEPEDEQLLKEVMKHPKGVEHWNTYVHLYKRITGKHPTAGCSSCKLNSTYRTLWLYYEQLMNKN